MSVHFRNAGKCAHVLLAGWGLLAGLSLSPTLHAADRRAREQGAIAFQTRGCESCHSITGRGGDRAPDLSRVGERLNGKQIGTQITKGGRNMPPFGGILEKDDVENLVAFLLSCKTDQPPGCRQSTPPVKPAQ